MAASLNSPRPSLQPRSLGLQRCSGGEVMIYCSMLVSPATNVLLVLGTTGHLRGLMLVPSPRCAPANINKYNTLRWQGLLANIPKIITF